MNKKGRTGISRRQFLKGATAVGAGVLGFPHVVPASALGADGQVAPSNRVAMGFIGLGGRGTGGMRTFMGRKEAQAVAVCDVVTERREKARNTAGLPPEAAYNDFRELLARDDIDAVQIATPDHWHALMSIAAAKAGKHIYCEKPLSNTIAEGRAIVDAVQRYGVVFQHGTQLRSLRATRFACELVRNGRIGRLHTITIGSPKGQATAVHPPEPVPEGMDWDLWLGPAPYAPYSRYRAPGTGWYFISDYSKAGWIAGFAVHDVDLAHWGMDTELTGPVEIEGRAVFPSDGLYDTALTFDIEFRYANGLKIVLTDTGKNPHGVRFEGTDGWVFTRHDIDAQPKSLLKEVIGTNEVRLYESSLHEQNFLDCIKTRAKTICPVEVAHRSTSAPLLGGIAVKLGRKLRWDPVAERFLGDPEADRLLSYAMRPPWHL
ncbi:MAG: Gfo/Idh/MocA family oxidoreductase [Planctomycetes bacterium]|nr:Gfo/Idh/MocA family oxidoreductase [Planctomycetota bacterium]